MTEATFETNIRRTLPTWELGMTTTEPHPHRTHHDPRRLFVHPSPTGHGWNVDGAMTLFSSPKWADAVAFADHLSKQPPVTTKLLDL